MEQVSCEALAADGSLVLRTYEVSSYLSAFALSGMLCVISAALVLRLRSSVISLTGALSR